MTTKRLGLLFVSASAQTGASPLAHVYVRAAIPHGYAELQPGQIVLTPPASTFAELEYQVTLLHEELELLRDEARRQFGEPSPSP